MTPRGTGREPQSRTTRRSRAWVRTAGPWSVDGGPVVRVSRFAFRARVVHRTTVSVRKGSLGVRSVHVTHTERPNGLKRGW